jgi:hypothetical protein
MALVRPAAVFTLLLLSTAPAFADASFADMSSATACGLDRVREIIAGAEAESTDAELVDRLIVENTADWLPDYTAFATGPEAAELSAAATAVGEKSGRATCRQLLPFAAISASAARISAAGGNITAGSVLETCEGGTNLCVPPATSHIIDQCGVALFTLPLRTTC